MDGILKFEVGQQDKHVGREKEMTMDEIISAKLKKEKQRKAAGEDKIESWVFGEKEIIENLHVLRSNCAC